MRHSCSYILSLLLFLAWGRATADNPVATDPTPADTPSALHPTSAEEHFAIAHNSERTFEERKDAVKALEALGTDGVPYLLRLIDDNDAMSQKALYALGKIGDPSALPKLRQTQKLWSEEVYVSGKLNVALRHAVRKTEAKCGIPPREN